METPRSSPPRDCPDHAIPAPEAHLIHQQVPLADNGRPPTGETTEVSPEPSPQERSQRSMVVFALGAIAIVFGAIMGWRWWQFQSTHVSTDNAQIAGHISPISAKISAKVERVLVNEGDQVEVGQPLIILEDRDLTLRQQEAEAALVSA